MKYWQDVSQPLVWGNCDELKDILWLDLNFTVTGRV